jgi:chromosome segregation ATPase
MFLIKSALFAHFLVEITAISLQNTPPINELYEEVLRAKYQGIERHERLLLDFSTLEDQLTKTKTENMSMLRRLGGDIELLRKSVRENNETTIHQATITSALEHGLDKFMRGMSQQMNHVQKQLEVQHVHSEEIMEKIDGEMTNMAANFVVNDNAMKIQMEALNAHLSKMERTQANFMAETKQGIKSLKNSEGRLGREIASAKDREMENVQKIVLLENEQNTLKNDMDGQEIEFGMIQETVSQISNQMEIDEFKEEEIQSQMTNINNQLLKKLNTIESEITFIKTGSEAITEPKSQKEIQDLALELSEVEKSIADQQHKISIMNIHNDVAVSELQQVDLTLKGKLNKIETEVHRKFRKSFMKKFRYD